ncbi:MAG: RidA family protein [Thermoguttaceae bacterium]
MKTILTKDAPSAIGPYSQGRIVGTLLFSAGQIPLDPKCGELVGETIEGQTEQVLQNLNAILHAGGTSWEHVIKVTVYMTDLGEFDRMNHVYATHLGPAKPARSTVQVAALPKNAKIEIELIAEILGIE